MEQVQVITQYNSNFMRFLADNIDDINANGFYVNAEYGHDFSLESERYVSLEEESAAKFLTTGTPPTKSDVEYAEERKTSGRDMSRRPPTKVQEATPGGNDEEQTANDPANNIPKEAQTSVADEEFYAQLLYRPSPAGNSDPLAGF